MILPTLRIGAAQPASAPAGPPIQQWPDAAGRVRVTAHRADDGYCLDWPALGRFLLSPPARTVLAVPCAGSSPSELRSVFERFVAPLYWQLSGGESLHAGAVCLGPRAFAFCATSGTGKSTIAYGLVERGHTVLTDDGVLLDATSRPALVRASARGVRLRRESATHFGLDAVGEALDLPVQTSPPVTPLGGVIVLDRETPGTPLDVTPLAGAAALTAVLAHAHHLDPTDSAMRGRSIRRYLDVLDSTPAWRLRYPSGFDRLPAALDAIERLAEQAT